MLNQRAIVIIILGRLFLLQKCAHAAMSNARGPGPPRAKDIVGATTRQDTGCSRCFIRCRRFLEFRVFAVFKQEIIIQRKNCALRQRRSLRFLGGRKPRGPRFVSLRSVSHKNGRASRHIDFVVTIGRKHHESALSHGMDLTV